MMETDLQFRTVSAFSYASWGVGTVIYHHDSGCTHLVENFPLGVLPELQSKPHVSQTYLHSLCHLASSNSASSALDADTIINTLLKIDLIEPIEPF